MGLEDLFLSSIVNLFGERIVLFIILYTVLGLLIITLKYSIFGKKEKKDVWLSQDPLSKTVYGFIVGFSSWLGALPLTFLFYYLWSLIETPNPTEVVIELPILFFSFAYGFFLLRNKRIKEKTKPIAIFTFSFFSWLFIAFSFLVAVTVEKIMVAQYLSAGILSLFTIGIILSFIFRDKIIEEITKSLE